MDSGEPAITGIELHLRIASRNFTAYPNAGYACAGRVRREDGDSDSIRCGFGIMFCLASSQNFPIIEALTLLKQLPRTKKIKLGTGILVLPDAIRARLETAFEHSPSCWGAPALWMGMVRAGISVSSMPSVCECLEQRRGKIMD